MIARSHGGVAALLCAAGLASAEPLTLPGFFDTGFDAEGFILNGGGVDAHYSVPIVGMMGRVLHEPGAGWLPNSDSSRWIWQTASGHPAGVVRSFRKSFELDEGVDLQALAITGNWAVAGIGLDVQINGISTGQKAIGAIAWSSFIIEDGFVIGTNTIDFVVQSTGSVGGFRVDGLAAVVEVPGPASAGAMLGGMLLLGTRRRRTA